MSTPVSLPRTALSHEWSDSRTQSERRGGRTALHDPLFWGLIAAIALGVSAVTGRWPVVATALAAVAGGCTMVAILLPVFPGFETSFPDLDLATLARSIAALGPSSSVCPARSASLRSGSRASSQVALAKQGLDG